MLEKDEYFRGIWKFVAECNLSIYRPEFYPRHVNLDAELRRVIFN